MTPHAYYNENDEEKAAWLRELIRSGIIAAGEVDTRSITAVQPEDLAGFTQYHFFAGIGVWSYALRLANWPDNRPVWTGSCPCPSFSSAGKGGGFDDPRHLWPDWARLIRKCKPATLFGEQVDDAIGYGWLDLVQTDLERENYAVGKAVLGACSVGAPHIRQRLYFTARNLEHAAGERQPFGNAHGVADSESERCEPSELEHATQDRPEVRSELHGERGRLKSSNGCNAGYLVHSEGERLEGYSGHGNGGDKSRWFDARSNGQNSSPGFVNGFWRDSDWVLRKRWNSEDWEWCPTEPGTFPLVAGASNRVLKLRGYGDAICAEVAKAFIEAASKGLGE